MNVSGITQKKGASDPEALSHPVMNPVRREPVHGRNLHLQVVDGAVSDIVEAKRLGVIRAIISHSADQASPPRPCKRKDGQEVGFIEVDVQFAVDGGTGRVPSAT